MRNVIVEKKGYKGWENCISISNGVVDLIATTDIGPRIIRFGFVGKENEFCEVGNQVGTTGANEWYIYGGHRLWHSPEEKPRSYELDNTPISWRKRENGIILEQPTEPWTQIKKEVEVIMSDIKPEVKVIHRLTNMGAWPVDLSVWALTVMAPGGKEIIPQANKDTGLLPNRMISLWPYTKLNDSRVYWGERYITLQQNPNMGQAFKLGVSNEAGWAAYANHGHLFVKKYKHAPNTAYPDYASSYETYTTDFMLEMESLSPLTRLLSGDSAEHTETWYLYNNVNVPQTEDEIDTAILPLIMK